MNIALVGNQNSGKTTLFNSLTGMNAKIGNWPGVTIEKKTGIIKGTKHELIDLPGTYSLNPYTLEEEITSNYIFNEKLDLIINVIDSTSIERGLYLTSQLLELDTKVIIALNMVDLLEKKGTIIDINKLKKFLKTDIIVVSALNGDGIPELINIINNTRIRRDKKTSKTFSNNNITNFENEILKKYNLIDIIAKECFVSKNTGKDFTDILDKIVLNKFLAFPIFILIMFFIYYFSVGVVGNVVTNYISNEFELITTNMISILTKHNINKIIISLICDGIIPGVSTAISFVPQLIVLFFSISILENTGYMSRIALILDKLFRKIGLSGKSLIPFIVGLGCSVPGILSTKILENDNEKKMTTVLTPFIPCSAKLPIIALFSGYFFGEKAGLVSASLYFLSIFVIILSSFIMKKFIFKNTSSTFISELPKYRLPNIKHVLKDVFEKVMSFIKRATTIILICSITVWFLVSFSFELEYGINIENSMLGILGKKISWIFYPVIGANSWEATVCAIQGLIAKEQVVSSMAIISGISGNSLEIGKAIFETENIFGFFTKSSAYAFMVFNLFSAPCFSAIFAMAKELGSIKRTIKAIAFQTTTAWLLGAIIYNIGIWIEIGEINMLNLIIAILLAGIIGKKNISQICKNKCKNCPYAK